MNQKKKYIQPGTVRMQQSTINDLALTYGIKEIDGLSVRKQITTIALRLLDETHPSEFKYSWVADWPKGKGKSVSVHRNIPLAVWNNIVSKWNIQTPSAALRTGLYIMWAKRYKEIEAQDKGLEEQVKRAMQMLEDRNHQKALGYSVPDFPVPNFPKSDSKSIYTVPLEEFDNEREAREVERLLALPAVPLRLITDHKKET